jgi:hypothetical protein
VGRLIRKILSQKTGLWLSPACIVHAAIGFVLAKWDGPGLASGNCIAITLAGVRALHLF